jgi:hypothetical protein
MIASSSCSMQLVVRSMDISGSGSRSMGDVAYSMQAHDFCSEPILHTTSPILLISHSAYYISHTTKNLGGF